MPLRQLRPDLELRLWKRDATRWEIPVKSGFRSTGTIEPNNLDIFGIKED